MLTLTQQEFTGLPQQLQLELLVAVVLCCIGACNLVLDIVLSAAGWSFLLADGTMAMSPVLPVQVLLTITFIVQLLGFVHLCFCRWSDIFRQHETYCAQQRSPVSACRLCALCSVQTALNQQDG